MDRESEDNKNNNESQLEADKNSFLKKLPLLILILAMAGFLYLAFVGEPPKGSALLSWNPNTESDLAGYRIYYGTSPRTSDCPPAGYPEKIDVGKTSTPEKPSHKLENLENGKTYYFSITSYDASGNESCFSDEMSKTIAK